MEKQHRLLSSTQPSARIKTTQVLLVSREHMQRTRHCLFSQTMVCERSHTMASYRMAVCALVFVHVVLLLPGVVALRCYCNTGKLAGCSENGTMDCTYPNAPHPKDQLACYYSVHEVVGADVDHSLPLLRYEWGCRNLRNQRDTFIGACGDIINSRRERCCYTDLCNLYTEKSFPWPSAWPYPTRFTPGA